MSKNAKFLDNLQKKFEDNETSLMFKSQLNKVKAAFYQARCDVKKRILTEIKINKKRNNKANTNENEDTSGLIIIVQEDDSNIFKLLQNFGINNLLFIISKYSRFVYLLPLFLVTFTVYTNILSIVVFMVRKRKKRAI